MATDTPRGDLLAALEALNRSLYRLGVSPLVDAEGAAVLGEEQLAEAVRLTGDYLLTTGRALKGYG